MPSAIDNTGGGVLGGVRTKMQSDLNIKQWFTDANSSFNVRPGVQKTKVDYPYANLFVTVDHEEQDSYGNDWALVTVQISIFGEGFEPTRYVKDYVYHYLCGKHILLTPCGTTLQGIHNPEPLIDRERSAGSSDIYHSPLRFKAMILSRINRNPNQ